VASITCWIGAPPRGSICSCRSRPIASRGTISGVSIRSYWYIVGLCVTFYSVIFPFRSTFAIKYFQHAHGLSLQEAGSMNAYVFLAAIFATPAFGLLADQMGRRAALMALGSLLLFIVFPLLAYTNASLWVSTVFIGIAFSLVPAVLWPAVPYLVTAERLGTAYGLMTMLQNIGMMLANFGAGALNDAAGASADNQAATGRCCGCS
jgi:MFS family permease